jgi:hypothetical protein
VRLFELFENFVDTGDSDVSTQYGVLLVLSDIEFELKNRDGLIPTAEFLEMLNDEGIFIDEDQLMSLVQTSPWNGFISKIENSTVVFKNSSTLKKDNGATDSINEPDQFDPQQDVVAKMAKRAAKKDR